MLRPRKGEAHLCGRGRVGRQTASVRWHVCARVAPADRVANVRREVGAHQGLPRAQRDVSAVSERRLCSTCTRRSAPALRGRVHCRHDGRDSESDLSLSPPPPPPPPHLAAPARRPCAAVPPSGARPRRLSSRRPADGLHMPSSLSLSQHFRQGSSVTTRSGDMHALTLWHVSHDFSS